jgi:hypothetical protein
MLLTLKSHQRGAGQARLHRVWKTPANISISRAARPLTGLTGRCRFPKVSSLTLEPWIEEFDKLKKRNTEIFRAAKGKSAMSAARVTN